jgi:hypothetical protein
MQGRGTQLAEVRVWRAAASACRGVDVPFVLARRRGFWHKNPGDENGTHHNTAVLFVTHAKP